MQEQVETRRRLFWSTGVGACGGEMRCGADCGVPGLTLDEAVEGTTVSTSEWVRGLVANILMTDGRQPDTPCGYRPGSQGGHWSESFITDQNAVIGSLLGGVSPAGRVSDLERQVQAFADASLQRLVERGVATSVGVTVSYAGRGVFNLEIEITGMAQDVTRVGLSTTRTENGWVWGH